MNNRSFSREAFRPASRSVHVPINPVCVAVILFKPPLDASLMITACLPTVAYGRNPNGRAYDKLADIEGFPPCPLAVISYGIKSPVFEYGSVAGVAEPR